jgi:hypothetical protein
MQDIFVAGNSGPAFVPAYVEGFLVPEGLRDHPGHTWVQRERSNIVQPSFVDAVAADSARRDVTKLQRTLSEVFSAPEPCGEETRHETGIGHDRDD